MLGINEAYKPLACNDARHQLFGTIPEHLMKHMAHVVYF